MYGKKYLILLIYESFLRFLLSVTTDARLAGHPWHKHSEMADPSGKNVAGHKSGYIDRQLSDH